MDKDEVKRIDIRQVLRQKAPKAARRIPGFVVDYLIRTIHQEELNDILTRYHDLDGVDFMQALIGYFDLTLEVRGTIPTGGRFIFASNHPLGGLDGICLSALIGQAHGGQGGRLRGFQLRRRGIDRALLRGHGPRHALTQTGCGKKGRQHGLLRRLRRCSRTAPQASSRGSSSTRCRA